MALVNVRTARIVARTLRWYVLHPNPAVRRMPFKLLGAWALRRAGLVEELVFHLALYRHLSEYYAEAAAACEAAAREEAA
jgi:hypothetical protein